MTSISLEDKFEVKNKALNNILDTTIQKLKNTPYGKKLFENAVTQSPDSETHFNLSKIYIGYAGTGVGGNCYREVIDKNKTRDVIYISDEEIKSLITKTLQKSDNPEIRRLIKKAKTQNITQPTSRFQSFLENHYKSIGQKPNQATLDHWNDLKLFAQIEKIVPLEKLLENQEIKNMLSDSLTHIVAHEISHAGQYNNGCQATTKQSFSILALKKENIFTDEELSRLSFFQNSDNKFSTFSEMKESKASENALEAGVMSSAMVAFILTNPSQEAMQTTIDYYDLRSGKETKKILDKYDLHKMRELGLDNKYTKEAVRLQNSLARDVFVAVVNGMDDQQQRKLRENYPDKDCSYDYTKGEALISINSSYRREIFGEKEDFDNCVRLITTKNKIAGFRDKMKSRQIPPLYEQPQVSSKIDIRILKTYQGKKQNS